MTDPAEEEESLKNRGGKEWNDEECCASERLILVFVVKSELYFLQG